VSERLLIWVRGAINGVVGASLARIYNQRRNDSGRLAGGVCGVMPRSLIRSSKEVGS